MDHPGRRLRDSTGMDIADKYVVEHMAKFWAFRYFK